MSGRTVLLVDDDPDAVEFLQDLLTDNDYEVLTASNATEGLARMREERPDLVCLDVLMPEESGISMYQKARIDPRLKGIPILISSSLSFTRELNLEDCLCLPDGTVIPEPDGIVEKPVDIEQFLETVRKSLS